MAGSPPSPKRLRNRQVTKIRSTRALGFGLAVGLAVGLTGGLGVGLKFGLTNGLACGLTGALAIGLAAGLAVGLTDRSPQAIGPRDVIRADGRYQLAIGLAAGLAAGLTYGFAVGQGAGQVAGLTFGLTFGLTNGLMYGLTAGLAVGLAGGLTVNPASSRSSAWARYYISVVINAARQRGPLRFGTFLDWAQRAGLLRVSGTAYQFRHRQLQDWLTSHPQ